MSKVNSRRLAIIVSHPIQYYVPLYRRLAQRDDVQVKVFFTWHGGQQAMFDQGFKQAVAWDIPLTEGYEFEIVPNIANDPGTHHFWGLRNPTLLRRVLAWKPDMVHLTGYAYASHLGAMQLLKRANIPVLFRGDSHLLDENRHWKQFFKRFLLTIVYQWPAGFLYVGQANYEYYKTYGVPDKKLFYCPHAIDVRRFSEPNKEWEEQARSWRSEIGLGKDKRVLLFAGKFEHKKQPVELMRAFLEYADHDQVLVMVGDGELRAEVNALSKQHPTRFCILPFQNQQRMPVVYRLGDIVVLPSAYGETWGLAINEALACGRPVIVSDRVGCAMDVVKSGVSGEVFQSGNWANFGKVLRKVSELHEYKNHSSLINFANQFDIETLEFHLLKALHSFN